MPKRGVHHLGFATYDYEGTVEFYTKVVGLDIAWQDQLFTPEGQERGRHVFFDLGNGTFLAFACSVPGSPTFPEKWATDINSGLGMPLPFIYHFAFWADSEEDFEAKRDSLEARGAEVTCINDHGWCKSFYFPDPVNGLMLEYCLQTREFNEDDKLLKSRPQPGFEFRDEAEIERSARLLGLPEEALRAHENDAA